MAELGLNIGADGGLSALDLAATGTRWVRFVGLPKVDLRDYCDALRARGVKVLLVLAREGVGSTAAEWMVRIPRLASRYLGHVDAVQAGNEADHKSDSSWSLAPGELQTLIRIASASFPGVPLIGPGLVSGQPSYLDGLDLSLLHAISVHPYGQRPTPQNDPPWNAVPGNFGYVGDLIGGYARFKKPIWITEVGVTTDDVSESFQARYLTAMLDGLFFDSRVEVAMWFCGHPYAGWGIYREDGTRRPAYDAFVKLAGGPGVVEPPKPSFIYAEGFRKFHDAAPDLIGEPLENEWGAWVGQSAQRTTNGLLFWSPAGLAFIAQDGRRYRYQEDWMRPEEVA